MPTKRRITFTTPQRKRGRTSAYHRGKRGYTGRYSMYYRGTGPTTRPSEIWKHLKVYNDPFSNAHMAPKIPDGKSVTSLGLSNAATYEITVTQQITNIVLFPGLETCAYVHETNGNNEEYSVMHLADKNIFSTENLAADNFDIQQFQDRSIFRWRRVSQGLHISLQNNAEENDGWWEACRVSIPSAANRWLMSKVSTDRDQPIMLFPYEIKDILASEMNRLPSYVSGDLRDIKYTQFNLRPEGNEHDFLQLRNYYRNQGMNAAANQIVRRLGVSNTSNATYDQVARPDLDSALHHDTIEHLNDFGWDAIIVRIHGRIVEQGNVGRNSALKISLRQNDELVYDERSINSRFQTKSPMARNFKPNKGNASAAQKVKTKQA